MRFKSHSKGPLVLDNATCEIRFKGRYFQRCHCTFGAGFVDSAPSEKAVFRGVEDFSWEGLILGGNGCILEGAGRSVYIIRKVPSSLRRLPAKLVGRVVKGG